MTNPILALSVDEFNALVGRSLDVLAPADELHDADPAILAFMTVTLGPCEEQTRRERDEYHVCFRCGKRADDAHPVLPKGRTGWRWLDLCHPCTHWAAGEPCCGTYDPDWRDA